MADVPEPKEDVHVRLPGASDDGEDSPADEDEGSFTLRNIDFSMKAGELLCVIGRVGSGKSSLVSFSSSSLSLSLSKLYGCYLWSKAAHPIVADQLHGWKYFSNLHAPWRMNWQVGHLE